MDLLIIVAPVFALGVLYIVTFAVLRKMLVEAVERTVERTLRHTLAPQDSVVAGLFDGRAEVPSGVHPAPTPPR